MSEIPPGKGKVVEVEGRQITVFNLEGRLVATSTPSHAHEPEATGCPQHGLYFDAFVEDSPARLRTDEECRVWIEGEDVWLGL